MKTPLISAVRRCDDLAVSRILKNGAIHLDFALRQACKLKTTFVVTSVKKGHSVDGEGRKISLYHKTTHCDDTRLDKILDIINLIIEAGADPNNRKGYCLEAAVIAGHIEVVQCLLNHGVVVPPVVERQRVLNNAFIGNKLDIIDVLIQHGFDQTTVLKSSRVLCRTLEKNSVETAKRLVSLYRKEYNSTASIKKILDAYPMSRDYGDIIRYCIYFRKMEALLYLLFGGVSGDVNVSGNAEDIPENIRLDICANEWVTSKIPDKYLVKMIVSLNFNKLFDKVCAFGNIHLFKLVLYCVGESVMLTYIRTNKDVFSRALVMYPRFIECFDEESLKKVFEPSNATRATLAENNRKFHYWNFPLNTAKILRGVGL